MAKYKLPNIDRSDLTHEEIIDLNNYLQHKVKMGYAHSLDGLEEAYLAGFALSIRSLTRKIGQNLHETATELEKLGNQFE